MSLIAIGPLRIKVLSRALSEDYWDGNWINVRAYLSDEAYERDATASGPIIHLTEVKSFLQEVSRMNRTSAGGAILKCMEPNLYVELAMSESKIVQGLVKIDPEQITEDSKTIKFNLVQEDLNQIISELSELLIKCPIKGVP